MTHPIPAHAMFPTADMQELRAKLVADHHKQLEHAKSEWELQMEEKTRVAQE